MGLFYRFSALVSILVSVTVQAADSTPKGKNPYILVTGDDAEDSRSQWDEVYSSNNYLNGKEPTPFLKENFELLTVGQALDLAMGEGRNTVFLAKKGFKVEGVDISDVAIRKAHRLAKENQATITTQNADLFQYQIKPNTYDLILNIDFLSRNLIPQIKKGLKKGGIVVVENFTLDQLKNKKVMATPREFLLSPGELKTLYKDFEILIYRETNDGKDAKARMIARKRE